MDVDSRITPTLHPAVLKKISGYDDSTAYAVTSLERALIAAYQSLKDVYNAREKAHDNPTWSDGEKIVQTADFATKKQQQVLPMFDQAAKTLTNDIEALERHLDSTLTSSAQSPLSSEIRNHFKAMPLDERNTQMSAAVDNNDTKTLSAVLGAPSYLSGLTEKMSDAYKNQHRRLFEPESAKRLTAMKSALKVVDESGPIALTEFQKAIGVDGRQVDKIRAAKNAAHEAFVVKQVNTQL